MGDLSQLPELAKNARRCYRTSPRSCAPPALPKRAVIHCVADSARRAGRQPQRADLPIHGEDGNAARQGTDAAAIVPRSRCANRDLVISRLHGLSPFQGTELDFVLRNLGVRTIVGVGVSVNVAIQNFAFDAVNSGYQVVIPRDAVAGFPPSTSRRYSRTRWERSRRWCAARSCSQPGRGDRPSNFRVAAHLRGSLPGSRFVDG